MDRLKMYTYLSRATYFPEDSLYLLTRKRHLEKTIDSCEKPSLTGMWESTFCVESLGHKHDLRSENYSERIIAL
ncbi:hypothetical protein V1477_003014 [Vespula maculifrons]|uniref:Uncharacterized protein n=2 Tax=Vespula TaxID=7451 RepID=A0A834J3F4_VESVU|nr:hypothetical protein HZH66_013730 [Vespula vulgaris]